MVFTLFEIRKRNNNVLRGTVWGIEMILLILSFLLSLYLAYDTIGYFSGFLDCLFFLVLTCVYFLLWGFCAILIGSGIGLAFDQTNQLQETYQLASFRDAIGIHGSFFIGSGSVDSKLKYYFYKKLPDAGYQADSVDATNAIIYQDETKQPYIDVYALQFTNKLEILFAVPGGIWYYSYKIHVPPNSIVQNYKLNLGD